MCTVTGEAMAFTKHRISVDTMPLRGLAVEAITAAMGRDSHVGKFDTVAALVNRVQDVERAEHRAVLAEQRARQFFDSVLNND